jgi:hypothetical protein
MTPREESDSLLNSAITMAMNLVRVHGSYIPFAMVIEMDGVQTNIAADDTVTQDRDVLAVAVQDQVKSMCAAGWVRAVGFARNISFRRTADGPSIAAVEVNLDHLQDQAVRCILPYELGPTGEPQPGELFATDPKVTFFVAPPNSGQEGTRRDTGMKSIHLTPHIRFQVPDDWVEISADEGSVRLRTPDGGSLSAEAREFRKPAHPGFGTGLSSEEMVSVQASRFGATPRTLASGRAFATHSISIGDPGQEVLCQVWHIVNQVAAWHHEALFFTYEPAPGKQMDQKILSSLDRELAACEFARSFRPAGALAPEVQVKSKPWWKIW